MMCRNVVKMQMCYFFTCCNAPMLICLTSSDKSNECMESATCWQADLQATRATPAGKLEKALNVECRKAIISDTNGEA